MGWPEYTFPINARRRQIPVRVLNVLIPSRTTTTYSVFAGRQYVGDVQQSSATFGLAASNECSLRGSYPIELRLHVSHSPARYEESHTTHSHASSVYLMIPKSARETTALAHVVNCERCIRYPAFLSMVRMSAKCVYRSVGAYVRYSRPLG